MRIFFLINIFSVQHIHTYISILIRYHQSFALIVFIALNQSVFCGLILLYVPQRNMLTYIFFSYSFILQMYQCRKYYIVCFYFYFSCTFFQRILYNISQLGG